MTQWWINILLFQQQLSPSQFGTPHGSSSGIPDNVGSIIVVATLVCVLYLIIQVWVSWENEEKNKDQSS